MSRTFPCERVELDFFRTAPRRFSNSVDIAATPQQLFTIIGDADTLPQWVPVIRSATWTSPEPRRVGATRDVEVRGGILGREEFLAWEPFRHIAFRFNESSTPALAAFAEEFRTEPIPRGCRVTWRVAIKLSGLARSMAPVSGPPMNVAFQRVLSNLRRYAERQFITNHLP